LTDNLLGVTLARSRYQRRSAVSATTPQEATAEPIDGGDPRFDEEDLAPAEERTRKTCDPFALWTSDAHSTLAAGLVVLALNARQAFTSLLFGSTSGPAGAEGGTR
jgi:cytosine/uracil/thiamine/allantoin permease